MYLLQDWTTIAGSGTTPFVQSILDWADLARFGDVVLWLEVRAVSNPGAGNVQLTYETSPTRDDSVFTAMASLTVVAGTAPSITKIQAFANPAVPLARWLRWKLTGTASGDWMVCFRIFACGGTASAGSSDPSSLNLTGWWRASYSGSPWTPTPSAGSSASNGNLTEATNPPATGSTVNGFTPADFDGSNDLLQGTIFRNVFVGASAGTVVILFNADTAAAAAANNYDDPGLVSDNNNAFNLGFSNGGVGVAFYDGAWKQPTRIACSTAAWHLAFVRWNGTTAEFGVDAGSLTSFAAGSMVAGDANSKLTLGKAAITAVKFFDGQILEVMTADFALSDTDRSNIRSYINSRYGLTL